VDVDATVSLDINGIYNPNYDITRSPLSTGEFSVYLTIGNAAVKATEEGGTISTVRAPKVLNLTKATISTEYVRIPNEFVFTFTPFER